MLQRCTGSAERARLPVPTFYPCQFINFKRSNNALYIVRVQFFRAFGVDRRKFCMQRLRAFFRYIPLILFTDRLIRSDIAVGARKQQGLDIEPCPAADDGYLSFRRQTVTQRQRPLRIIGHGKRLFRGKQIDHMDAERRASHPRSGFAVPISIPL